MKIGVDAGCLGIVDERLKVGVYQVVKNMLIELGQLDKENNYILYSFFSIEGELMKAFGPQMKNVVVRPAKGWLKLWLPMQIAKDNIDLLIAANQALPTKFPFSHYKTLSIFYDIAFEKYPEYYSYAASVGRHAQLSRVAAKKSDSIIAISKATKTDLERVYKTPSNKILIAYPGASPFPHRKAYQNTPYFLFVGAFKKSKNIPSLLKAFAAFCSTTKKSYELLLVGGDKWMDPEIEKVLDSFSDVIRQRVKILGFVDDATLASLYEGAVAFVSPSLYEGFGLTFVEAMSMGCPVIGSHRGSIPEVVGNAGIFVEPVNINQLMEAMQKITQDEKLRNNLIQEGKEQSKRYSWKKFAKTIYSAIEQLS